MYLQNGEDKTGKLLFQTVYVFFGKYILISFFVFILAGCLSGQRPPVRISPELDKRIYQIPPLPVTVGLYIEPELHDFVQKVPLKRYDPATPYYVFPDFVFPVGESLASRIKDMSKILFHKVIQIDNPQDKEYLKREALDGILSIGLKNSDIDIYIDISVWRAIGRHNLSIIASFSDPHLNEIWKSEIAVEGKGFDFATSKVEREWWATTGPNFAPAVDDAIQKLVYELAQSIVASIEISDYVYKRNVFD
ncbi:MAG: hypothetical protein ACUBOA_10280 [Candidatus Loosdrechtia sp.]|uniref:hypothetical protein n=1 Tax=Candidatus Loosdrechtia sp. TaxID=3101272 RepID=UPI003A6C1C5A|nr:MAG: hypothetical protein QY305_05045 [Candidatus Jettenia sp. AMX2]